MQKPSIYSNNDSSADSTTHNVEVFCHMILEEFLTSRNMHSTLRAFRKEWDRPNEVRFENLFVYLNHICTQHSAAYSCEFFISEEHRMDDSLGVNRSTSRGQHYLL